MGGVPRRVGGAIDAVIGMVGLNFSFLSLFSFPRARVCRWSASGGKEMG